MHADLFRENAKPRQHGRHAKFVGERKWGVISCARHVVAVGPLANASAKPLSTPLERTLKTGQYGRGTGARIFGCRARHGVPTSCRLREMVRECHQAASGPPARLAGLRRRLMVHSGTLGLLVSAGIPATRLAETRKPALAPRRHAQNETHGHNVGYSKIVLMGTLQDCQRILCPSDRQPSDVGGSAHRRASIALQLLVRYAAAYGAAQQRVRSLPGPADLPTVFEVRTARPAAAPSPHPSMHRAAGPAVPAWHRAMLWLAVLVCTAVLVFVA
eukprot:SAG31_NODE_1467_length_8227_cov_7.040108_1_plen_273_part_00